MVSYMTLTTLILQYSTLCILIMNLNDKLKQERTGLTASQYSDLQELFVDRYVDGMSTKDLVEYVYNDMMQYVENQPEQEFLDDCKDYWDDAYDEIIQEIKELDS